MIELRTVKVKEIGKVVTGHTPPTQKREFYGDEFVFIKPTDMKVGERYVTETEEMLSDISFEKFKKSLIPPLSTCVVTIGSLGKKMCFTNKYCFTNQAVNAIIPYDGYDKLYVYYLFKYINPAIENLSNGTASGRDNVSKGSFENLNVIVSKSKHYQQAIASILSAYDDLIENNNERIKLLEETARELYKEWFVRLRFPGYKKTKLLKGLPDWETITFGSLAFFKKGTNPKYLFDNYSMGYEPYINIVAIEGKKTLYCNDTKTVKVYDSEIVMIMDGSRSGTVLKAKAGVLGSTLSVIRTKKGNNMFRNFIFYFLQYNFEWIASVNVGAAIPHANRKFIEDIPLLKPPHDIITKFESILAPIEEQIKNLQLQNTQLRQIRDCLLPRLIGGKLQVKLTGDCNTAESTESHQIADTIEKSTEDAKVKSNPFFQRRVLAAHIIERLKDEPTFGHVKLMKLMYLCEHLAEIETASHYHRDAAGPYDNRMIRSIDSQLKKAQWFECKKTDNKYQYTALHKKDEYKNWFTKYYSDKEAGIENLLHLFGKEKTEKAEMVATLYEAWRDLKDKKQLPTDQAIVYEVLNNWHESKQRISEERWLKCLQWMKEKNWIT